MVERAASRSVRCSPAPTRCREPGTRRYSRETGALSRMARRLPPRQSRGREETSENGGRSDQTPAQDGMMGEGQVMTRRLLLEHVLQLVAGRSMGVVAA